MPSPPSEAAPAGSPTGGGVGGGIWITGISVSPGRASRRWFRPDLGVDDPSLAGADVASQLAMARLGISAMPASRSSGRIPPAMRSLDLATATALQGDTGVVFASVLAGSDALVREVERHYAATYGAMAAGALRQAYLNRLDAAQTEEERLEADRWFEEQRRALKLDGHTGSHRVSPDLIADILRGAHDRFAHLVQARGPSLGVSAAGASTAAALATAEDMIRCGRVRRVVVVALTTCADLLTTWVGAEFASGGRLRLGARQGRGVSP
jgi:uncharacterized membrane protein (UPF0136 family)